MGSHVGLARQLPLAPVKVVGAIDFISWLDINFVCGDRAILKEVSLARAAPPSLSLRHGAVVDCCPPVLVLDVPAVHGALTLRCRNAHLNRRPFMITPVVVSCVFIFE